jgi:PDZ domain/PEGA domain
VCSSITSRRSARGSVLLAALLAAPFIADQAIAPLRAQPPQSAPAAPASTQPPPVDPRETAADSALAEGRRLFDAAEYERAATLFDQAVMMFDPLSRISSRAKDGLLEAYELRGRAQFSLNKTTDARSNFEALLRRSPTYALSDQVSPRVLKMFDDVRNAVTGRVALLLSTPDAEVKIDGEPLLAISEPLTLAEGAHTVTASRAGYAPLTQTFTVASGPAVVDVPLQLVRISALLAINTVPAGVVVSLNGVVRGTTEPGGNGAAGDASSSGIRPGPSGSSKTMVLSDLPVGTHTLEFTRDCYVPMQRRITISELADLREPVVTLKPAVAIVEVAVKGAGGSVFLDDAPRGATPMTMPEVCEGTHTIEVRSSYGRYVRRLTVKTDDKVTLEGAVKPAFGLVSVMGQAQNIRGGVDPRMVVERALADDGSVMLYAPAADRTEQASKAEQLPPGWLAFDRTGRAVGSAAASIAPAARIDISTQLSRALEVQGVAGIAVTSPDGDEMLLSLLAAGSAEPDVLAFKVSDAESMSAVRRALATVFPLYRHSAGLLAIDVLDIPGATVALVEPGGAAAAGGLLPGEVITSANGRPVKSVADLEAALAALPDDRKLLFDVRAAGGGMRKAQLTATLVPRALVMSDQTLLANKAILDLRQRLPSAMNTRDEPVVRLNLAIALMHAKSWALARAELERVTMPQGPGISNGTVQYLLGLCYDALGLPADAARAWKVAAADATGLLTEDGPPIADMAASRLAALERSRR